MNKHDLTKVISNETGLTQKDSNAFIDAMINAVTEALKKGEEVQLVGFGKWSVKNRAERKGINPQTQAEITIPAKKVPSFKCGKELKTAVAE